MPDSTRSDIRVAISKTVPFYPLIEPQRTHCYAAWVAAFVPALLINCVAA